MQTLGSGGVSSVFSPNDTTYAAVLCLSVPSPRFLMLTHASRHLDAPFQLGLLYLLINQFLSLSNINKLNEAKRLAASSLALLTTNCRWKGDLVEVSPDDCTTPFVFVKVRSAQGSSKLCIIVV